MTHVSTGYDQDSGEFFIIDYYKTAAEAMAGTKAHAAALALSWNGFRLSDCF